jgi:hypothetical protein
MKYCVTRVLASDTIDMKSWPILALPWAEL